MKNRTHDSAQKHTVDMNNNSTIWLHVAHVKLGILALCTLAIHQKRQMQHARHTCNWKILHRINTANGVTEKKGSLLEDIISKIFQKKMDFGKTTNCDLLQY